MANTYDPGAAISKSVQQFESMFPNVSKLAEAQASAILRDIDKSQGYSTLDEFMSGRLYTDIFGKTAKAYKGGQTISGRDITGGDLAELATKTAAETFLPISRLRERQRQFNLSARPTPASTEFAPAFLDAERTRFVTEEGREAEKRASKQAMWGAMGGLAGTAAGSIFGPDVSKFLKPSGTDYLDTAGDFASRKKAVKRRNPNIAF